VALIADAFETFHVQMVPDVANRSARESVELLLRHVAEVVIDSTFSRCIPALIEGAERDPRVREFHHGYSAERRRELIDLIARGIEQREFRYGLDPELATTALLGVIFYRRLMTGEPLDPDFADLRLHRLEANIQPGNAASIALVKRAGFVRRSRGRRSGRSGAARTGQARRG
jgi:hypothetical protein